MRNIASIFLLFLILSGHSAWAKALSLDLRVKDRTAIITLTWPGDGKAKAFTLENPDRLVVDMPDFPGGRSLSLPGSYGGSLIERVRVAQFNPEVVRAVFDMSEPFTLVETERAPGKITLKVMRASVTQARAEGKKEPEAKTKDPAKPKKSTVEKPVIIIDAGHGGQDPGAIAPAGTQEKELVLLYALTLKKALMKTGRYRVVLTRDADYFILLRERTAIARQAKGDLFISLHADTAPGGNLRGLSVYTLSENASDDEAAKLAASENKADILSGMDLSLESEDVANILISLAQRETNNTSAMLADVMVTTLRTQKIPLLTNPHRFAGFAVLKAPDMPSVLVELGFISHPEEEKKLRTADYRKKLVDGLVKSVDAFFKKRREGII